jgi:hypothetical protein
LPKEKRGGREMMEIVARGKKGGDMMEMFARGE